MWHKSAVIVSCGTIGCSLNQSLVIYKGKASSFVNDNFPESVILLKPFISVLILLF